MTAGVKTHRRLTTERVVEAALRLADEDGLEAVSLRRLAASLGVTPMAIYRHVRDKNQLLDLMADRLLDRLDVGPAEGLAWQERLRRLAAGLVAVLEAHPAAPFLLSRPFDSPAALRLSEALLEIFDRAGFSPDRSARLLQVLTGMILGPSIHRATYAAAWRNRGPDAAGQQASRERLSSAELPHLSKVAEQMLDWSPGLAADRLTIELLVAGLEALAELPQRGR